MKVSDLMTTDLVVARADASVAELAKKLTSNNISGLPIVDDQGVLLGLVTERDLFPKLKGVPFSNMRLPSLFGDWLDEISFETVIKAAKDKEASEVMSTNIVTIDQDEEVGKAAGLMAKHSIKRLPVLKGDKLVGIITRADILKGIAEKFDS